MEVALLRAMQRLERLTSALAAPLARGNFWLLVGFSAVYFLATGLLATVKLLWFDELFTYHLARLDRGNLWNALREGVDLNPPLSYLFTQTSLALLGDGPLATRLPAIVGFWVLLMCLYHFVARRCGRLHGWLAMLIPLATWAYPYAYEARPYGVVMGCCGLALLCWQRAAEGERRPLMLAGLALSLAAAVASHYYAVLLFGPFLLGEIVRALERRRIDWPMVLALGLGLLPLVPWVPIIQQGASYAATHTERVGWSFVHDFYHELLGRALLPLSALLVTASLFLRGPGLSRREERTAPPLHEIAVAVGLMALPVAGMLLVKLTGGGVFGLRYIVSAVAGVSVLCAFVHWRLSRGAPLPGGIGVLVLFGWFLAITAGDRQRLRGERAARLGELEFLAQSGGGVPVVVPGPVAYLQLAHYAPPELADRLVFAPQPETQARYFQRRQYSIEGALLALHRWRPQNLVDTGFLTESGREYLVFTSGLLMPELEAAGVQLEVKGLRGRHFLLLARPPETPDRSRVGTVER